MYTIYADGELLYSPMLANEGYAIINPTISREINKAGSLSFVLPPDHPFHDSLTKLKTIMTVYHDDVMIFRGRVLTADMDFYKRRTVYCEGELAYLNDSVCRPYTKTGTAIELFTQHITKHNEQVDTYAQFTVGNVDVDGTVDVEIEDYSSTWEAITSMIESFGGFISVRTENGVRYIDYLKDSSYTSGQTILFGQNMLDLTEHITAENVFTVLIPLGKGSDNTSLTIESVNENLDYIQDDTACALFGKIWRTHVWNDIDDADELLETAQEYLKHGISEAITLKVQAIDLHLVDVDTDRIDIGCKIRVKSSPHSLDDDFMCTSLTLDLLNLDKSTYTFGQPDKIVSGVMKTDKDSGNYTSYSGDYDSFSSMMAGTTRASTKNGKSTKKLKEENWQMGTDIQQDREHIKLLAWANSKIGSLMTSTSGSINLTDDQIRAEVSEIKIDDIDGLVSSVKSSVNQTAGAIVSKAESSVVDGLGTRLTTAETFIDGVDGKIALKVSKNGVISAINMSSENITISSSKINLEGYVTATNLASEFANFGFTEANCLTVTNLTADGIGTENFHLDGEKVSARDVTIITSFTQASGEEAETEAITLLITGSNKAQSFTQTAGATVNY